MKSYITTALLVFTLVCKATTYYVAPSGNDNNRGTINTPWATWQKAFETAQAGDTVYFRGGVYYKQPGYGTADIVPRDGHGHSGTAGNYIHYLNYPGENPILDCSLAIPKKPSGGNYEYNAGLYIDGTSYLHFRGLTITNVLQVYDYVFSQGLVCVDSKFQIFENMTVSNITGRGVYYSPAYAPDSTYFINCDIYNCVDSFYSGGFAGGWGDGFNIGNEENSYLQMVGCRVWNCSDDAFNTWGQGLLVVRNCWAFKNGKLDGDGCGFKMNVPEKTDNILHRIFTNNISAYNTGNTGAGFTENNNGMPSVNSHIYNNTSYHNMTGFTTIGNWSGAVMNNDYRNNIAYDNSQYNDEESQDGIFYTNDHNSWNAALGVTVTDADFLSLDVDQLARPRKSDGSLPDIDFLKLVSNSDLIDKGFNVGLPYSGSAPDLGYSEYKVLVSAISVTGESGASTINSDNGTLQLYATITPANAIDKSVTWSIQNGTGHASISSSGLVTAITNGTVIAKATAKDGSGVYGQLELTLTNQTITLVTNITVSGAGGLTTINTDKGTLQLFSAVSPDNAEIKTVTWSIINGTGQATINQSGLITAVSNGVVTARATAKDGSGVNGQLGITISNQIINVTGITVTGAGVSNKINTYKGELQLSATVLPADATNKAVTWSVTNGTGKATINSSGLLTAVSNGKVTAKASAKDGSGIYGTLTITISNQIISVAEITVSGENGISSIPIPDGTLQLSAIVLPTNATDKSVSWRIVNGSGEATINASGLVTAVLEGIVTAFAMSNDGSSVSGSMEITITNQVILVDSIIVTPLENSEPKITNKSGMLQMVAKVYPEKASNKMVKWSLENHTGNASVDDNGLLTAKSNGTVKVIAAAEDGTNVSGFCMITISDQVIPTNLDAENDKPVKIYQIIDKLYIESNNKLITDNYCYIYSITGALMKTEKVLGNPMIIDISSFPDGIYIISFKDNQSIAPIKFVIQK